MTFLFKRSIKKRIKELKQAKLAVSVEEAERRTNDFVKKVCKKLEEEDHKVANEEQRIELRNFVYWMFIDNGSAWILHKEHRLKFEAFLTEWQKKVVKQ